MPREGELLVTVVEGSVVVNVFIDELEARNYHWQSFADDTEIGRWVNIVRGMAITLPDYALVNVRTQEQGTQALG